jgi:hypothetical protein
MFYDEMLEIYLSIVNPGALWISARMVKGVVAPE